MQQSQLTINQIQMTTKAQLITLISADLGVSKKATHAFIDSFSKVAREELLISGEALLPGIGKIKTRSRAARTGRNPRTGESLQIGIRKTVRLSSTKALKSLVNA